MSLGGIIRQRREELRLTQDQASVQAGISKPYLSNIETDRIKNPPTDGVLANLERVLNFSRGELIRLAHLTRTPLDVRQEHEMLKAQVAKLRGILKELMDNGLKEKPTREDLCGLLGDAAGGAGNLRTLGAGVTVPIINKVSAGYPHCLPDLDYPPSVADEYIRCPDVHDPQAFGARVVGDAMEPDYREGDIVVFSPNTPARDGDDCFVRFDQDGPTTFKRFYLDRDGAMRLQPLNNKYPAQSYPREKITGLWPAVCRIEQLRR